MSDPVAIFGGRHEPRGTFPEHSGPDPDHAHLLTGPTARRKARAALEAWLRNHEHPWPVSRD